MADDRWEVTLRQFLEHLERERGVVPYFVQGPDIAGYCIEIDGASYPLPAHLGEDAVLPPEYLESLCLFFGIPRDDFGLDPAEDD